MKDMSLLKNIKSLKESNVKALKIEGRLKSPFWVKEVVSIYRKVIDGNYDNIDELYNSLKQYSAREVHTGHLFEHNDLTGKNEEWKNYKKSDEFKIETDFFIESNEIIIDLIDGVLNIKFNIFGKSFEHNLKIDLTPKKAKQLSITGLADSLKFKEITDNKVQIIIKNSDAAASSSVLQKISAFIIKELRIIINNEEKFPDVNEKILQFLSPKVTDKKRARLLGDFPDKVIILQDNIDIINDLVSKIKTISVYLNKDFNAEVFNRIKNKDNIIISLPAVFYEKEALSLEKMIKILYNNGFKNFEANSYSGLEILNSINCSIFLGSDMPVLNHLAAEYFYAQKIKSVYVSGEAEISSYKALSSFCSGNIECVVYSRQKLFITRVKSEFFNNQAVFTDKFNTDAECFKERDLSVFVSGKYFSLINPKIKNENILFDSLTADLRYVKNPLKALNDIFNNRINPEVIETFNFFKKLQ